MADRRGFALSLVTITAILLAIRSCDGQLAVAEAQEERPATAGTLLVEFSPVAPKTVTIPAGSRVRWEWLEDGRSRLTITTGSLDDPAPPGPTPTPTPQDPQSWTERVREALSDVRIADRGTVVAALRIGVEAVQDPGNETIVTDGASAASLLLTEALDALGGLAPEHLRPVARVADLIVPAEDRKRAQFYAGLIGVALKEIDRGQGD